MEFNSERLTFREFNQKDFTLFSSVFTNEQVMKYALFDRFTDEEELKLYFQQILKNNTTEKYRKAYEFAVFKSSNNSFIGIGDIEMNYQNQIAVSGEMGYFLLPDFWGNGYATEIGDFLINFSFTNLKLHRVTASCNSNNKPSERVMQKLGMAKEGEFRKARFKNGKWDNEFRYAILAEEWK